MYEQEGDERECPAIETVSESVDKEESQKGLNHQTYTDIAHEPLYNEILLVVKERKDNTIDYIRLKVEGLDTELTLSCPEADGLEEKVDNYRERVTKVRNEAKDFAKANNFKKAKDKRKEASEIEDQADATQHQADELRNSLETRIDKARVEKKMLMEPIRLEAKLTERVQDLSWQIGSAITNEGYDFAEEQLIIVDAYRRLRKVLVQLAVFRWHQEEEVKILKDNKISDLETKVQTQKAIIEEKDAKLKKMQEKEEAQKAKINNLAAIIEEKDAKLKKMQEKEEAQKALWLGFF
jgi:hypothetical protein